MAGFQITNAAGEHVSQPSNGQSNVADERDPIVVLAADENFAMPLAVTVRSALDNLSADVKLRIYVLDGGLAGATKDRLLRSWPQGRFQIEWLTVGAAALAGLPVSGHANLVAYYRILIPRVLPTEVRRAIYLDSDLLVRADLSQLWNHDLAGQSVLAAQDCAAPYLDASIALKNYARCGRHLGSSEPVLNYRQLGLSPRSQYFNSGVLLLDLAAWRAADLPRRMLECLKQHEQYVRWWDQYALNVELAGQWGPLDLRWNQGSHVYRYPTWEQSPFDRQTFDQLRDDPYVVHFTTRHKPWKPSCVHPLRRLFFECVDRTDWAGWRPSRLVRLQAILEVAKRKSGVGGTHGAGCSTGPVIGCGGPNTRESSRLLECSNRLLSAQRNKERVNPVVAALISTAGESARAVTIHAAIGRHHQVSARVLGVEIRAID